MSPKKKKGRVKKSKKSKPAQDGDTSLTERYRQSLLKVAVLKEHLAFRKGVAQEAQCVRDDLRCRLKHVEQELHQERLDTRDIHAELSRQNKSVRADMTAKVRKLESEVSSLQQQLGNCQDELKLIREVHVQMEEEKKTIIADLQSKLDNMESEYEKILHGCLDSLLSHLAEARLKWEDESTVLHQEHKDLLTDFGLNPLDI